MANTPRITPALSGIDKMILASEIENETVGTIEEALLVAGVITEFLQDGPLMAYIRAKRIDCIAAIRKLIDIDAEDVKGVREVKSAIGDYVRVCEWVVNTLRVSHSNEQIGTTDPEFEGMGEDIVSSGDDD